MSPELTLYSAEICPYAQRTRILLALKGIDHQLIEIDIDNKPEWFKRLSPTERVPIIRHEDHILWESAVINEYIDVVFPGPSFMPQGAYQQALIRIENRHFDQVFLPVIYKLLFEQDVNLQASLLEKVTAEIQILENRLALLQDGKGPYWCGDALSLADINIFPFFERFEVFDYYRDIKIPQTCRRLQTWFDTLKQHPAFSATMHNLDYFIPQYAHYASGTAQGLSAQAFRAGATN